MPDLSREAIVKKLHEESKHYEKALKEFAEIPGEQKPDALIKKLSVIGKSWGEAYKKAMERGIPLLHDKEFQGAKKLLSKSVEIAREKSDRPSWKKAFDVMRSVQVAASVYHEDDDDLLDTCERCGKCILPRSDECFDEVY